ncbi:MAG: uncharacterized protein KVP18_001790 [Porospora cf. gigantea A]|uniref:uncharacterized protein n=1 Tax=Porospora cf. gigantea A TaxID=2853593 RepID=UPI00355A7BEC|nr:MAG: hypothetical protein KVP18_001790 [Porospora cf. gigantea A]
MQADEPSRSAFLTLCELKQHGRVPVARVGAQMASRDGRNYLFGGGDEASMFSDLLKLNLAHAQPSWSPVDASGFEVPVGRLGHVLEFLDGDSLILFGGLAGTKSVDIASFEPPVILPQSSRRWKHSGKPIGDTFIFSIEEGLWRVPESITSPESRVYAASCGLNDCLWLQGGLGEAPLADLWVFRNGGWSEMPQEGSVPSARFGHRMTYLDGRVYLFGGDLADATLYSFDPLSSPILWRKEALLGTPPLPRRFHSFSAFRDRLVIFGGESLSETSDVYVANISALRWQKPLYDGRVAIRGHTAISMGDKLVMFGGAKDRLLSGEVYDPFNDDSFPSLTQSSTVSLVKKLMLCSVMEVSERSTSEYKFKIVTIGDAGVGKTCLLKRFASDVYNDVHIATVGVDFQLLRAMVKGKLINVELWDTAGQERFGTITHQYYRNAAGFVLVFDATRRETFDHIASWVHQVEQHCDEAVPPAIVIMGNKYDLKAEIVVSESEAMSYAQKIKATFLPTSAKTAANVDLAFLHLSRRLYEARLARPPPSGPRSLTLYSAGQPATGSCCGL